MISGFPAWMGKHTNDLGAATVQTYNHRPVLLRNLSYNKEVKQSWQQSVMALE
jgi:hypothetical protein